MTTTTLRLNPDERPALDAAAEAAGLGPCSYARRAVMASVGRSASVRRRPDSLARAIGQALGDLGRIGNLLNQMARHAHVGGHVSGQALDGCKRELADLRARRGVTVCFIDDAQSTSTCTVAIAAPARNGLCRHNSQPTYLPRVRDIH